MRIEIQKRIEMRLDAMKKGFRQNLAILSSEGFGKTSILTHLISKRTGEQDLVLMYVQAKSLHFNYFTEAWVNALMHGLFLSQFIKPPTTYTSLLQASDPIIPETTEVIRQIKRKMKREKPGQILRELFQLPALLTKETGKKVVLVIDEFDAMSDFSVSDPFSILAKEITVHKETLFVITSSRPSRARNIIQEKLSLLFGNFEIMALEPLGSLEIVEAILKRIPDYHLHDEQKRFLIRLTDGHPLHLDIVLNQIRRNLEYFSSQRYVDPVDGQHIPQPLILETIAEELTSVHGRLKWVFEQKVESLPKVTKDKSLAISVLLALAHGRSKLTAIASFSHKKHPEVKKILQRLVDDADVIKKGPFYLIANPLFRFWLLEVFEVRQSAYISDVAWQKQQVLEALRAEWVQGQKDEKLELAERLENLFKAFRGETIDISEKKLKCPQFSEIIYRPHPGRGFTLFARGEKIRWFCQMDQERVTEEDVLAFLDEIKHYRRGNRQKVIVALAGMEQNAKLIAQENKIQIWDLRVFNALLEVYGQRKLVLLPKREFYEQTVGILSESLHTA